MLWRFNSWPSGKWLYHAQSKDDRGLLRSDASLTIPSIISIFKVWWVLLITHHSEHGPALLLNQNPLFPRWHLKELNIWSGYDHVVLLITFFFCRTLFHSNNRLRPERWQNRIEVFSNRNPHSRLRKNQARMEAILLVKYKTDLRNRNEVLLNEAI